MTHPYVTLEGNPIWIAVAAAIDDLVQNGDLVESTPRNYIVGYLCEKIIDERKAIIRHLQQS